VALNTLTLTIKEEIQIFTNETDPEEVLEWVLKGRSKSCPQKPPIEMLKYLTSSIIVKGIVLIPTNES